MQRKEIDKEARNQRRFDFMTSDQVRRSLESNEVVANIDAKMPIHDIWCLRTRSYSMFGIRIALLLLLVCLGIGVSIGPSPVQAGNECPNKVRC
jgi:hypothetical protein